MTKYYRLLAIIASAVVLTACIGAKGTVEGESVDEKEKEAIAALSWLDSADPQSDAQAAVTNKQFAMYSMGGRGGTLPGVSAEQSAEYLQACGTEVLPGATDIVHGDLHLTYLQRAHDYAEAYNRVIAKHCLGN